MACFLIMTEGDFEMIESSMRDNVHYLSQTTSGVFVEVAGGTKQETKKIANEIKARFPKTESDKMQQHHLIPHEFHYFFEDLEIDIDDYAVPIPVRDHTAKITGFHNYKISYNDYWRSFVNGHMGADPELVRFHAMLCINQCMKIYNIDFDTTVRYRNKSYNGK